MSSVAIRLLVRAIRRSIEDLIRALIENGLDEENRKAALKWLNERVAAYMALQELRIV